MPIEKKAITVDGLLAYCRVNNDIELVPCLNVSKSTVSKWRSNGIPAERQAVYELLSKHELKADLSEFQLNRAEEA